MIFEDLGSFSICGMGETAHQLSGIESAPWNFVHDLQCPGILPLDWRASPGRMAFALPGDLPGTSEVEVAIYLQRFQSMAQAGEHVAQTGLLSRGSLRQRHTARATASTCANVARFEQHY